MITAVVDFKKCESCDRCEAAMACNTRAIIKIDVGEPAAIDQALCHGCTDCVLLCEHGAISITET